MPVTSMVRCVDRHKGEDWGDRLVQNVALDVLETAAIIKWRARVK
jgi:hypothetical protein